MVGELNVAAIGDSLMWGQGNRRQDRFSALFTAQLQGSVGRPGKLVWDSSRSGATIRSKRREREEFVDTYPDLFPNGAGEAAFISGSNHSPAAGLYGEVPSSFPTVLGQVEMIPAATGKRIDIALVDGGVNDISPEDVINPQVATGKWIERYDGEIRKVAEDDVTPLLRAVRDKCPSAVILYFGFFEGVSYNSSPAKIRAFFKHEYNDDFKWWFNQYVYRDVDVNDLINERQTRGEWFLGRWQYWTRQAVNAVSRSEAERGPGVVYVPSDIGGSHAAFTAGSRLWEDYELPTSDPATAERLNGIPRQRQVKRMAEMYLQAVLRGALGSKSEAERRQMARDLDSRITGPISLKRHLQSYAAAEGGEDNTKALIEGLAKEIHRIQHGMVASLAHPNATGSASYARNATERYAGHLKRMSQVSAGGATANKLDAVLRRCNLRGDGALAGAVHHLDVDSIALRVTTAATSSKSMVLSAFLMLGKADGGVMLNELLTFQPYRQETPTDLFFLNKRYQYLEPNEKNRLTLAVFGVSLEKISSASLVLGPDPGNTPGGRSWTPQSIEIEINGQPVHTVAIPGGARLGPGDHIDLGWPRPAPGFKPPTVALQQVPPVAQLEKLENTASTAGGPTPVV